MIDFKTETIVSLAEASRGIPSRRPGRRINVRTIARWHQLGLNGIKLDAFWGGGTLMTSLEAIERFFAEVSRAKEQKTQSLQMPAGDVVTEPEVEARLRAKKLLPSSQDKPPARPLSGFLNDSIQKNCG